MASSITSARRVRPKAWKGSSYCSLPQGSQTTPPQPPQAIRGIKPATANATVHPPARATSQRLRLGDSVRDSDDSGASSSVPHTAPAPSHPHGTAAHWLQTLASAATAATNLSGKGSEMSLASAATNLSRKDEEGDACASAAKNLSRKGSESSLGSALADDKGADDKDDVATSTVSELKTTHDKACISQEYATEWHKSRDTATSHVTHSLVTLRRRRSSPRSRQQQRLLDLRSRPNLTLINSTPTS